MLENQRDNLLAFAVDLDRELAALAQEWQISVTTAREVLQMQSLPMWDPKRRRCEAALQRRCEGVITECMPTCRRLSDRVVRASSLVENLNSRLRTYFFLRRQLGKDYLTLLQFFLNHRRYLRSEVPSRVGKSPAELLTGELARSLAGTSGVHPVLPELKPRRGNQRLAKTRSSAGPLRVPH